MKGNLSKGSFEQIEKIKIIDRVARIGCEKYIKNVAENRVIIWNN
jgi:hypothetical protein